MMHLSDPPADSRVLIVDDEPMNVTLLRRALRQGGFTEVRGTSDPREAVPLFLEFKPDLVLLDMRMPHLDGIEVMRRLRSLVGAEAFLPILVLTADITPEARRQALSSGATDFLTKPFDLIEVDLRIRNLLRTRVLNQTLEERVRERTADLEAARVEVIERLAVAAEFRDDATGAHTRRVGETTALLAAALGLPGPEVEVARAAAPLHDVGKIGIPDLILLKAGPLTAEEFAVMRTHTTIGGRILSGGRSALLRAAEQIALTHHERWDGSGYPHGLAGAEIPLVGRLVAVADVFDALTHARPYKPAWTPADAVAEIERAAGRHFDPEVVAAFLSLPHAALV